MLGERLFNLRKERGMTQKELAEALLVHQLSSKQGKDRVKYAAGGDLLSAGVIFI